MTKKRIQETRIEQGGAKRNILLIVTIVLVVTGALFLWWPSDPYFYRTQTTDGSVIVGSKKSSIPQADVTLSKWTEESKLSISYPLSKDIQPVKEGNTITWKEEDREIYYKEIPKEESKPESPENMDKFEFDIKLYEKPDHHVFTYEIETEGLEYYYQPELTDEEKAEGAERPENVTGSYAVYYRGKIDPSQAEIYKTGKAFHIYRPKVIAADGKWIWGKLHIDEDKGILTVTVDPEWLANASYPVIVDPTFGFTSIGGSSQSITSGNLFGSVYTGALGTVTSMSVYLETNEADLAIAIYRSSDSVLVGRTSFFTASDPVDAWFTEALQSPTVVTVQDYVLVAKTSGSTGTLMHYDTGTTNQGKTTSGVSGTTIPDPATFINNGDRKYSIYATYTEATPTPTPTNTPTPTPTNTPTPTSTPTPGPTSTPTPTPPASSAIRGGVNINGGVNLR